VGSYFVISPEPLAPLRSTWTWAAGAWQAGALAHGPAILKTGLRPRRNDQRFTADGLWAIRPPEGPGTRAARALNGLFSSRRAAGAMWVGIGAQRGIRGGPGGSVSRTNRAGVAPLPVGGHAHSQPWGAWLSGASSARSLVEPGSGEFCPPLGLASACGESEAVRSVFEDVHRVGHAVGSQGGCEPVGVLWWHVDVFRVLCTLIRRTADCVIR
jgi:hypothetical protein